MPSSPPFDLALDERLRLLVTSYRRLTGKLLLDGNSPLPPCTREGQAVVVKPLKRQQPRTRGKDGMGVESLRAAIWNAPRAIVAHGTEEDPVFFYGNRLALQLFEMNFNEFARLPSRFSAEPLLQEERARLLEQVTRQGYVDGYSGMRIAKSGRRFMIADGTVWNLTDERGIHHGQAAVFIPQGWYSGSSTVQQET